MALCVPIGWAALLPVFSALPTPSHDTSSPVWTNAELLAWLAGVIIPIGGGLWYLLHLIYRKREETHRDCEATLRDRIAHLDTDLKHARDRVNSLEEQLRTFTNGSVSPTAFDAVRKRLAEIQELFNRVKAEHAATADALATRERLIGELQESFRGLEGQLGDYEKRLRATTCRVRRAVKLQGKLWEERVPKGERDKFRTLGDKRSTPIISVLNLKGGVGKTTVVANLGAALSSLGHRVLLVDLDLQGSLTNLFIPPHDADPSKASQYTLYKQGLLLENFFQKAAEDVTTKLHDYAQPFPDDPRSSVVPTADTLAYTEQSLTLQWLLRIAGHRDPRFLLRKALHLKQLTKGYDFILLDCPPLITLSCVNALAASDYLLVPVLLSKQATARVPTLLKLVQSFKQSEINKHIELLGIVANRAEQVPLGDKEANIWAELKNNCSGLWDGPVTMLRTVIPRSVTIRTAEDDGRPLNDRDKTFPIFLDLAQELKHEIENRQKKAGRAAGREGVPS
jgi:cellulose biosynthesis protein BcsQ